MDFEHGHILGRDGAKPCGGDGGAGNAVGSVFVDLIAEDLCQLWRRSPVAFSIGGPKL